MLSNKWIIEQFYPIAFIPTGVRLTAYGGSASDLPSEVLKQIARGASNPEIAEVLCITVNTVKTHISHILAKLQVDNRTQAAAYAVKQGLLRAESST